MESVVIGRWLAEAVTSRKWCDVSILCGGRHFWAHRLVLSAASPFIRGLLLSRSSDDIPTTIVIADFSHGIVEALLQYIYSGEVSLLPEHVEDFLALSEALKIHVDTANIIGMSVPLKSDTLAKPGDFKANEATKSFADDYYLTSYMEKSKNETDFKLPCKKLDPPNYYSGGCNGLNCDPNDKLFNGLKKRDKTPIDESRREVVSHNDIYGADKTVEKFEDTKIRKQSDYSPLRAVMQNVPKPNKARAEYERNVLNLTTPPNQSGVTACEMRRNERVVRPIPSLMPIESMSTLNERKSPNKRVPELLDLSTLRGNLNCTSNSAFERVRNPSPKVSQHPKDSSILAMKLKQDDLRYGSFPFNYHKPLRLGFVPDQAGNQPDKRNGARKMPFNKVLDSPWNARKPIFYRHKAKCRPDATSQIEPLRSEDNDNNNNFEKNITKEDRVPHLNGLADKNPNFMLQSILDTPKTDQPQKPEIPEVKNAEEDPKDDACALKCPSCLKMFTSKATLASHVATHVSRARYKCDQCDKSFSQLRNYKYHVSVHKGTKEFAATCNVCGKYFNDRGYLSSHMKIHRNRKEYQCPHCPKSFNQRVAYNMHVRIHTGVKPHQCEACGKAFSRKMLLKQHARTHSGEKPYACSSCGKRFADRSNMTLHMRLHSGVKPFSCNLCPKSFTKKHHLKTHLNYHTGNKPYACTKCGLTFSQSSNMRTHMKKCSAAMNNSEDDATIDPITV